MENGHDEYGRRNQNLHRKQLRKKNNFDPRQVALDQQVVWNSNMIKVKVNESISEQKSLHYDLLAKQIRDKQVHYYPHGMVKAENYDPIVLPGQSGVTGIEAS